MHGAYQQLPPISRRLDSTKPSGKLTQSTQSSGNNPEIRQFFLRISTLIHGFQHGMVVGYSVQIRLLNEETTQCSIGG